MATQKPRLALLTTVEAAERLGVHPGTVRRYVAAGALPATKLGPGTYARLADLTRTVEEMGEQFKARRDSSANLQQRADLQHERIDLAARELAEVSARLQAAAAALRESI